LLSFHVRQIHPSAWLLVGLSSLLQVLIFPLARVLHSLVGGIRSADRGAVARAPGGGAGDRRLRQSSGCEAGAGVSAGLRFRNPLVCGHVLLDLRHHASIRRLSAPLALLALFLFCLYLGLYHGLFGLLLSLSVGPGRDNRLALVAAPFLWVAVELARTRVTGFPWNLLGTAQVDNISLSRITTWTGSTEFRSRSCW
jgi:hypothetical protein